MSSPRRSSVRWTPAGLLTLLAIVVLVIVAYSLGLNAGRGVAIAAGILVLVISLTAAGAFYQSLAEARDRSCFPPPGKLIDAGGLQLHVQVLGNPRTEPVVIFENGEHGAIPDWAWIAPEVARSARVLLYDRPGTGWSPLPLPGSALTAGRLIEALQQALAILDLAPPYVLVGRGMGGLLSQVMAAARPETVAGMVLVDPRPVELAGAIDPSGKPAGTFERLAVHLGLPRLSGRARRYTAGLPEQDAEELVATLNAAHNLRSRQVEGDLAASAAEQISRRPADFGDIPLVVLSAIEPDPGLPSALRGQVAAAQQALAARCGGAAFRAIPDVTRFTIVHDIEAAQAVTDAIREVVTQAKNQTH
jgi:pimeloyl-ACP methyl ester carboxylesterase